MGCECLRVLSAISAFEPSYIGSDLIRLGYAPRLGLSNPSLWLASRDRVFVQVSSSSSSSPESLGGQGLKSSGGNRPRPLPNKCMLWLSDIQSSACGDTLLFWMSLCSEIFKERVVTTSKLLGKTPSWLILSRYSGCCRRLGVVSSLCTHPDLSQQCFWYCFLGCLVTPEGTRNNRSGPL